MNLHKLREMNHRIQKNDNFNNIV